MLAGWLALCGAAAAVGLLARPDAWYGSLAKPPWQPPDAIFGPVWSALYTLMAIAAWLVSRRAERASTPAVMLFIAQLAVNAAWSPLFFRWHQPLWALADLTVLLVLVVLTIRAFASQRPAAAWLLAPYLLWCAFAWTLNAAIWWLNVA